MKFGAIIIGDEILSGKRQDKHMSKVIESLSSRGLELSWGHYLGDDRELITSTIKRALTLPDVVFSFGGIGATPDDHTRQCAAASAGLDLKLHPDAETEIRARFIDDPKGVTPQRLEMGTFPVGSNIIPNPFNRIPGFNLKNIYFLPGFPQMAWPMMQWVLDTHYSHLFDANRIGEAAIIVREAGESLLIELMKAYSVVVLPEPVGPVTRTRPWSRPMTFLMILVWRGPRLSSLSNEGSAMLNQRRK